MKVVRPTLNILLDKLEDLNKAEELMRKRAESWSKEQEYRENGYTIDQYHVSLLRERLEESIVSYRRTLAEIYDFMGDKGLV